MAYPTPANFTAPLDAMTYANTVTYGIFWNLILLAVYVVAYVALSQRSRTMPAFTATSFLGFSISTILYASALIPELTFIVTIVLALVSFIMLMFHQGSRE